MCKRIDNPTLLDILKIPDNLKYKIHVEATFSTMCDDRCNTSERKYIVCYDDKIDRNIFKKYYGKN